MGFSGANFAMSIVLWKLHQRPVVAFTGAFSSLVCLFGLTLQYDFASLSNGFFAVGATNALVQHGMHVAKVKELHCWKTPSPAGIVVNLWLLSVALFALDRVKWVVSLWGDD